VNLDGHLALLDGAAMWRAMESAAEQAEIGLFVTLVGAAPRVLYVSPRAAAIAGRTREAMLRVAPWELIVEEDRPAVFAAMERPEGAPPITLRISLVRPDGTRIPIELSSTRVATADSTVSFGCFRDVSVEHANVERLKRSEARFRFLVEAAPDGVVILQRGMIVFINPKAAGLLGCERIEDALGKSIVSFLPPADGIAAMARIREMLRTGSERAPSDYRVLADPDRVVEIKSIPCEWEGSQAVLAFARDVTERIAIQRRLVDADRLAALGTLAAGVAHEINNPLTYAQLSTQRIARMLDTLGVDAGSLATMKEMLRDVEHGITRVASITQALRAFARPDDAPPGMVDVEAVLARAVKMVDNDLRHVARLVRDTPDVPAVTANASRLEQVFVNILLNAIQALPQSGRSHEVRISVTHTGERVTVAIADTGRGIPAAIRDRIFDPFFTTRTVGEGMGLGLAVSKSLVESFGGSIDIESTEGVGTTARVTLRVHQEPAKAVSTSETTRPRLPRRRILIVDDEPQVRSTIARLIEREHDVETAANGADALAAIARVPYDVIFCDVMMPGMSGHEVYRRIAEHHAELRERVVFMSGGVFGPDTTSIESLPNLHLPKPFKIEQLFAIIGQLAG
jgi:PAS domain S-box-containing protein